MDTPTPHNFLCFSISTFIRDIAVKRVYDHVGVAEQPPLPLYIYFLAVVFKNARNGVIDLGVVGGSGLSPAEVSTLILMTCSEGGRHTKACHLDTRVTLMTSAVT